MNTKILAEDFLQKYESPPEKAHRTESEPITIWLPVRYKAKYDLIQARSDRKFGKFLKEVIEKSIDKVDVEKKTG